MERSDERLVRVQRQHNYLKNIVFFVLQKAYHSLSDHYWQAEAGATPSPRSTSGRRGEKDVTESLSRLIIKTAIASRP